MSYYTKTQKYKNSSKTRNSTESQSPMGANCPMDTTAPTDATPIDLTSGDNHANKAFNLKHINKDIDESEKRETKEAVKTTKNSADTGQRKARNPKCSKCANHGKEVPVKGHKRKCPYIKCRCKQCNLTHKRRHLMKETIFEKRKQKEDKADGTHVPSEPVFVDYSSAYEDTDDSNDESGKSISSKDIAKIRNRIQTIAPKIRNQLKALYSKETGTMDPLIDFLVQHYLKGKKSLFRKQMTDQPIIDTVVSEITNQLMSTAGTSPNMSPSNTPTQVQVQSKSGTSPVAPNTYHKPQPPLYIPPQYSPLTPPLTSSNSSTASAESHNETLTNRFYPRVMPLFDPLAYELFNRTRAMYQCTQPWYPSLSQQTIPPSAH